MRFAFALVFFLAAATLRAAEKPNILVILADDVGYGDLSCYGGKAPTPNCDRVAREGLKFTSAYATDSTCTPSRYSLLTGRYAFRQKGTGVLPGDAKLIIPTDKPTLPGILKSVGYRTGVVGKWHLGLGAGEAPLDWNQEIRPSPNDVGFDYSFIMAATGDRVPCVYVEDRHVVGLDPADPIEVRYTKAPYPGEPDGVANRAELRMDWSVGHNAAVVNGVGRIGYMKGGKKALWKDETMSEEFTRRAVQFIERSKEGPFFLYFATHNIHVPRLVGAQFVGKSGMGPRGDSILEFDWQVGEILATLERLKLTEKTLVILSSDNGPVLDDGYKDEAVKLVGDHRPAGPWSGGKYTILEGGTRVPMLARWPGRIKPGVSEALISQVDFAATFAELAGTTVPTGGAPDSLNMLPALLGDSPTGREFIVEDSNGVAIRVGSWKFIPPGKKAGAVARLYDLEHDPAEKQNVAAEHPEQVTVLGARLEALRGREGTAADGK